MRYTLHDLLDNFRIRSQRENFQSIIKTIEQGVEFRGTNLWVLVFAIFIASLGLNVNSPAVIIGAMLVSPLMGPIMGMGLAMGINDLALLRKSAVNYAFAAIISLLTSTLYFKLSPIHEAHSEILARTAPNIYDVLIAFVGGLAGILATASKLKGNVLPGVAIATALMPPLCTAGYGIATGQGKFFVGAFYLFVINTVFIALATLITVRFMHFPLRDQINPARARRVKHIIWAVTALTILPSVYLGYEIVVETRFRSRAEKFIESEAVIPGDFLLKKNIDTAQRSITLVFGGKPINEAQKDALKQRLKNHDLEGVELHIRQGFSTEDTPEKDSVETLEQNRQANLNLARQIFNELVAQGIQVNDIALRAATRVGRAKEAPLWLVHITTAQPLRSEEKMRIKDWLKVRIEADALAISFTETK